MGESQPFDQETYWRERHEKLRGDHRATGNISRTSYEMRQRKVYQAYYYSALLNLIRSEIFNKEEVYVADIGCGNGFLASLVTQSGFSYRGYDISPIAVEDSSKLAPAAKFQVHNIVQKGVSPADILIASEVLFHITDDSQWRAAIANIASSLSTKSIFIFTETFVHEVDEKMPQHFRPRTQEMYVSAFKDVNLRFLKRNELRVQSMPVFTENSHFVKTMHLVKLS